MSPHEKFVRAPVMLAPSMIAADWSRPVEVMTELAHLGCEWLHFDAMDGHFVPNLTLGPMFVEAMRPHSKLHFDCHLMLANSGDYIEAFAKAGADSISVHFEGNPHLHRLVAHIKDCGAMAGVVLNPATPVHFLDAILPDLDYVLVMSVDPGFSGQKFLSVAAQKVEQLATSREELGLSFLIQVDGGMSPQTAPRVAGADVLVCGASSVFIAGQTLAKSVGAMREAITLGSR